MNKYDPMTGELITEEVTEAVEESQEAVSEPETTENNSEGKIIGYDPMTGEPIREQVQTEQAPEMNFDPMTGKPIGQAAGAGANAKNKKPAKKIKKPVVWAVVAAIAVVVILVFVGITSGAFLSKRDKVLVAMVNTVEKTKLMENFDALSILASDSYTVAVEMDVEDVYLDAQYAVKGNDKQLSGSISADYIPEIDFIAGITSSKVMLQLPDIDDHVFVYNYKNKKDGYITESLSDDEIEAIDTLCETFYSQKAQKDIFKEIFEVVKEEYKELEFEKVDKEKFKVDGKARKCVGYKTTITEDNFENILDGMEDVIAAKYEDALEEADIDLGDLFDEMRDEVEYIEDLDITFYIYQNEIACISMEVDKEEVQLLFKGGEKNMPNIELEYKGHTIMELTGSTDGSVEEYELDIMGEDVVLEYDYKSGEFVIEADEFDVEGILKSNSKGLNFELEKFKYSGRNAGLVFNVALNKGASMKKFKGEEFDLGTVDESDLEDLVEDIYSELY